MAFSCISFVFSLRQQWQVCVFVCDWLSSFSPLSQWQLFLVVCWSDVSYRVIHTVQYSIFIWIHFISEKWKLNDEQYRLYNCRFCPGYTWITHEMHRVFLEYRLLYSNCTEWWINSLSQLQRILIKRFASAPRHFSLKFSLVLALSLFLSHSHTLSRLLTIYWVFLDIAHCFARPIQIRGKRPYTLSSCGNWIIYIFVETIFFG